MNKRLICRQFQLQNLLFGRFVPTQSGFLRSHFFVPWLKYLFSVSERNQESIQRERERKSHFLTCTLFRPHTHLQRHTHIHLDHQWQKVSRVTLNPVSGHASLYVCVLNLDPPVSRISFSNTHRFCTQLFPERSACVMWRAKPRAESEAITFSTRSKNKRAEFKFENFRKRKWLFDFYLNFALSANVLWLPRCCVTSTVYVVCAKVSG